MGLAEKETAGEDLQDHSELEKDEGVGKKRRLENADGHPLHDEKYDGMNDEPGAFGRREQPFVSNFSVDNQANEAADEPAHEGHFNGHGGGGAF